MKHLLALPQAIDMRGKYPSNGSYSYRSKSSITTRVWHHSLTKKNLGGSDAASFNKYHISLGWPGCGYAVVIEPKNIINTSKGKRARVVVLFDSNRKTYHVGDSNAYSFGVCVAGDYRSDVLDGATKATIDEVQEALVKDGVGKRDKSHNEMPGYGWKACCVFDYKDTFSFLDGIKPFEVPNDYAIQEGDTFWGIAHNNEGITVEDLIAANPGVEPQNLKIGQKVKFGIAKNAYSKKLNELKKTQKYPLPNGILRYKSGYYSAIEREKVKKLQRALNAVYFKVGIDDGYYGMKTLDAVKRFQKVYLPFEIDGVYGPNTHKKLLAILQ